MTVSIACWKAWKEMGGSALAEPVVVAGHSLGEYTAMVVAGVIGFGDAVKLVHQRGAANARRLHKPARRNGGYHRP